MTGEQCPTITADPGPARDARSEPRLDQRRRQIILRTAAGETSLALKNISSRGASGTVGIPVAEGTLVTLVFERGRSSAGQVRWARGHEIGIELSVPLPLVVLAGPPPGRTVRERRIDVRRLATLIVNGQERAAVVRNVSTAGMLVESACRLTPGQAVDIRCGETMRLSAHVRWADKTRAGLRLAQPLCLAAFDEATS